MFFAATIYFATGLGSILDVWKLRGTCVGPEAHMIKANYAETATYNQQYSPSYSPNSFLMHYLVLS